MRKDYDELEIVILKNLCLVVGLEYNRSMFLISEWNKLSKWTLYERDCFSIWLCYFLKKTLHLDSEQAKKSSTFFTNKYGWEIGLRPEIAHGLVNIHYKNQYKQMYLRRYSDE